MDIDVEHDGHRTKVTPPSKAGEGVGGASSDVGGASGADDADQGSKVSGGGAFFCYLSGEICIVSDYWQEYKYLHCSTHTYRVLHQASTHGSSAHARLYLQCSTG